MYFLFIRISQTKNSLKVHSGPLCFRFSLLYRIYKKCDLILEAVLATSFPTLKRLFSYRGNDWQLLKTKAEVDLASLTLGELLKKKAEDGVVVLIMIWGETTSIMGTHDTETENFFKGEISFLHLKKKKCSQTFLINSMHCCKNNQFNFHLEIENISCI